MPDRTHDTTKEIQLNLKNYTFFHASDHREDVIKILKEGFKREWRDEDGRWFRDGNLGIGIYLSCDYRTSLWFGNILLEVTLKRGTKILDTSIPPDPKVLNYLKREFGSNILTSTDPRKVIPKNKNLTLNEFANLIRYHYFKTWPSCDSNRGDRWPTRRINHSKALKACANMLKLYNFHGFGHPADDNGIVIFQPERINIIKVIAEIPNGIYWKLAHQENPIKISLELLSKKYPFVLPNLPMLLYDKP